MAITYEAAVSLLEDTVATLSYTVGTGDTGVVSTFATTTLVNIDKASVKRSMNTADHSGGQNPEEIHRGTKFTTSTDLELKLYVDAIMPVLRVGLQIQLVTVATMNAHTITVTVTGIITDVDLEFAGPSTMKLSMKPYAVGGIPSYTAVYA